MALATRRTVGPAPAFSDRLGDVLDHELLVKLGWDPKTEVFTPDPAHRLFGWRVCPVRRRTDHPGARTRHDPRRRTGPLVQADAAPQIG